MTISNWKTTKKVTIILLSLLFPLSKKTRASVISFEQTREGVNFTLDKGRMWVHVVSEDIIEVKYTGLGQIPDRASLVVAPNAVFFKTSYTLKETPEEIIMTTARLKIRVNRKTNAIAYTDLGDQEILSEAAEGNKSMRDTTIAGIKTYSCSTRFHSPASEALFGLGCHPLDSLSINYKGRDQKMAIKYLTGAIPVLLSSRGYGLLWDNYSASDFHGAEDGNSRFSYVSESGRMVDYYFFYGPSFDQIIGSYRRLTGVAPMYPKWVFGLFQSQDRYKSQAEILTVKDKYRGQHIPVDAIVQDWYYWEPLPIGSHIMNPGRYPDPKAMVDELHKANLHAMISIWPVFGSGTPNFDALKRAGGLTSITWDNFVTKTFDTYYDAHNPAARDLYWKQASDSLVKRFGWDAWWVDQCEPDNGELLDERKKAVFSVGQGIDYFNTYSLEHSKGLYANWRKDIPGKRAFFLIRQSFAGEQRNAATLWSSDITTTFASFRNQVPQAINACISGIPYWTSDIGGYLSRVSKDGVPDWSEPGFRELFTRWFQFGAFSPIFRIHGKGERALFSSNWDENTRAILLKYDRLRYRLLPYIYSLSARVTREDYTLLRSLAFDFRTDAAVYSIPDQYMFGPAFMVSPVTTQLYSGAHPGTATGSGGAAGAGDAVGAGSATIGSRKVYLPGSVSWYDFWTGKKWKGGQTVDAPAPIDIMPLFVKAGSIIPMGPVMEYATQRPADTLELRVYPGADGQFSYYEDANDGYDYEKGQFVLFTMNWSEKNRELVLSDTKGSFPGMLASRIIHIVLVQTGKGIGEEETRIFDKTLQYTGKMMKVSLP